MILKPLTILLMFTFSATSSYSATWSSTSISFLTGSTYKAVASPNDDESKNILTLEHSSGWKYGDNFFFTDITGYNSKTSSLYSEWAPRLSSSKVFKQTYGSFLKDVLLAGQYNFASSSSRVELLGLGMDFLVPHFDFLSLNTYVRDDIAISGSTFQISLVWAMSFDMGVPLKFKGFIDYAGKEGSGSTMSESNILAQPQLMWMIEKSLSVGIEYQYWKNKFGINGLNESTPQLLVNWVL